MLVRFFLERPVLAWVGALLLALAGVVALARLPVAQYPDIAPPTVRIAAQYPGASARLVEESVTQILEQECKGLKGLVYFDASSNAAGEAELLLTFEQGTDPDLAQLQVQNKVNQVAYRLPRPVQQSGVTVGALQRSFLLVAVFSDRAGHLDEAAIADWMTSRVLDQVARVPGVGEVRSFGSQRALRVWLRPHQLHGYGLVPADVVRALETQNTTLPVGELGGLPAPGGQQMSVAVTALSRLHSVEQFADVALKAGPGGSVVRLADVASIEIGSENYGALSRLDGRPASGFAVMLAPGANALATAEAVRARIAALAPAFPPGVEVAYPEEATRFVKRAVRDVGATLIEAAVLVALVMLLFLGSWRAALVPLATLPVVLLGTAAVLDACGYSINTLTLAAMVLAIGLLVDDAIVVVEHVERTMLERGCDARTAVALSMRALGPALAGVALVLGAIFVPMAFFPGAVGVIYRQFSVTLVAAMGLSVLLALTLAPLLCALLLRRGHRAGRGGALFARLQARYGVLLRGALRRPALAFAGYAALALAAFLAWTTLPRAFLPDDDQGTVVVRYMLPPGASAERAQAVAQHIERHFREQEAAHVDSVYSMAGTGPGGGRNGGLAFVALKDWASRKDDGATAQVIAARATEALSGLREARAFAFVPPPIDGLGEAGGLEFWLQKTGEGGDGAAARLVAQAGDLPGMLYVDADGGSSAPQLRIDIDQRRALALGLDLDDVNATLATAWGGSYVNDFLYRGQVRKVVVQAEAPYRAGAADLGRWYVRGGSGAMTPLSAFASARWETGPEQLRRFNGLPAVQVTAAGLPGSGTGALMDDVERLAAALPDTALAWSGLSYQERMANAQAPLLYAASALFVFLCLAALYGRWTIPFAVLLAMPLGVIGAVAAAWAAGMSRDIFFQVGVLTTAGLSAKNAVLVVEAAQARLEEGASALTAVHAAACERLRPILMTSLAFGAGIVPLLLADGPGAGVQRALGTGVLGGVAAATMLGVFLIPLCYLLVARRPRAAAAVRPAALPALD